MRASHFVRSLVPLPNDAQTRHCFQNLEYQMSRKNITVDEKGTLTFFTRVHHGSIGPILTYEKRDEVHSCISYGGVFRG